MLAVAEVSLVYNPEEIQTIICLSSNSLKGKMTVAQNSTHFYTMKYKQIMLTMFHPVLKKGTCDWNFDPIH